MTLTAAQVWYVTRVYPERVTHEEASPAYDEHVTYTDDRAYWDSAARVLNELALRESPTPLRPKEPNDAP